MVLILWFIPTIRQILKLLPRDFDSSNTFPPDTVFFIRSLCEIHLKLGTQPRGSL